MKTGFLTKASHHLDRYLPEQRLFLRSDTETRFIRLTPLTQASVLFSGALIVGWTILATSVLLIDSIGAGSARDEALREQQIYADRLNELSRERDMRAKEARMAQERFNAALAQVSEMQSRLLASEDRRREFETGIEVIQTTLRRTMKERDNALARASEIVDKYADVSVAIKADGSQRREAEDTVEFLTATLSQTSGERDSMALVAASAEQRLDEMRKQVRLEREKNDRVFSQLEDAVSVSLEPLDEMFNSVGMPPARILETVRRGYSGQGGPLTPLSISTKGEPADATSARANNVLDRLDTLNLYRIAAQKAPFGMPVKSGFRYTSGFGPRWGRMHKGTDFAAATGTPVYATADGEVIWASRQSAYGKLIKIRHEFGIETRFAHLNKIHVKVGQRVSRGDRIGDIGNTGRSTGPHLHYEVRIGSKAVNPMTYIKAAKNVF
ncbi:M23 family metallopeptidase [Brevirhabdus pacifica]|uniref:M23 family metallopeptidase n=1 Tax=Brevirhabdus pacifica TaxID=1267768 RepID=UPI0009F83497|nr:M23 family metallopeptidase [Brevirhabdus pacifica]